MCAGRSEGFVGVKGVCVGFTCVSRVRIDGRGFMPHSPYPVPRFPHGERLVELGKASEGEIAGTHVKFNTVK